ncbi:MAG TPA: orotate phosphoribosyltransferase [Vicinamibacterales bacterium]|jgi:orotate phosphoribosyltransferase
MNRDDLLDLFRRCSALLEGHFRLSSGLHSPGYLQCALVLQHPQHAATLGAALADHVRELRPATVLSPALGGLIIAHEVARALGARAIFAEREDGALRLRRGFSFTEAERVVVVEDVVTTGGSTRETIQVATAAGAQVMAATSIVDRSGRTARLDVPLFSLLELSLPTYDPSACPLCAQGVPISKPGSRQMSVPHQA